MTPHDRAAFAHWMRTGRRRVSTPVEFKFNPYHDPRNGQFTFAPGGPRSVSGVVVSDRRAVARAAPARPSNRSGIGGNGGRRSTTR